MFPREKANEILRKFRENDDAVNSGWEGLGNIQFPRDNDPEAVPSEKPYDFTPPTPPDEHKDHEPMMANAGPDIGPRTESGAQDAAEESTSQDATEEPTTEIEPNEHGTSQFD